MASSCTRNPDTEDDRVFTFSEWLRIQNVVGEIYPTETEVYDPDKGNLGPDVTDEPNRATCCRRRCCSGR